MEGVSGSGEGTGSRAHKLSNLRVRWFTDNQNVVCILQVGSAKSHIQVEA